MRTLIKIVFVLSLIFSCVNLIKAECDDKTISNLKLQASNIEVNYEHVEDLYSEDFDMQIVNLFDVHVTGLTADMYILVDRNIVVDTYEYSDAIDGVLTIDKTDGGESLKIIVYSTGCNEKLRTINISIPFYNYYYKSEECSKYPDVSVCSQFLDYEMTYEKFNRGINDYINKLNNDNNNNNSNNNFFSKAIDFIVKNVLYVIVSFAIIIGTIVLIIIYRKRRELS